VLLQPKILRRATPPPADAPGALQSPVRAPAAAAQAAPAPAGSALELQAKPALPHKQQLVSEVLSVLQQACGALVSWGEPDAIAGLHAHALSAFGPLLAEACSGASGNPSQPLAWMGAARAEAAGSYEAAAQGYAACLSSLLAAAGASDRFPGLTPFLEERAAAAYAATADWDGLARLPPGSGRLLLQAKPLAALDRSERDRDVSAWEAEPQGDSAAQSAAEGMVWPQPPNSSRLRALHALGSRHAGAGAAAALRELRAEHEQVQASIALAGSEGLRAAAPLLTERWLLGLHAAALQERLEPRQGAAVHSAESSICADGFTNGAAMHSELLQLGAGARVANVRPWVEAERALRLGGVGDSNSAAMLLAVAAGASRSQNWRLAERMLGRAEEVPVQALRARMERLALAMAHSGRGAEVSKAAEQAAELWRALQADDPKSPQGTRAEAFLLLASHRGAPPEGTEEPMTEPRCLEAAVAAAPAGTALAARALAAYGDWLHERQGAAAEAGREDSRVLQALQALQAYCASLAHQAPGSAEDQMPLLLRILQVAACTLLNFPCIQEALCVNDVCKRLQSML
jgi:hypothetical protein